MIVQSKIKSQSCHLKPLISPFNIKRPAQWEDQFGRKASLNVEIGFGLGDTLVRNALKFPERNFVGIEQNWDCIYKTLKKINSSYRQRTVENPVDNIKILRCDARVGFQRLFGQKTIDQILCLFPFPWPKKKHIKNRLFSHDFLKLLNSRLKPQGTFNLVTDHLHFFEWVLEQTQDAGFKVATKVIRPQFDTKYERKWCQQGQNEFFELILSKENHFEVPVKEDMALRSYRLKNFELECFQRLFHQYQRQSNGFDKEGDISVIYKNILFDAQKQTFVIHVIVAEDHLTQHFRMMIQKDHKDWYLCKADGQNFFPTPGIAHALKCVYETTQKIPNDKISS